MKIAQIARFAVLATMAGLLAAAPVAAQTAAKPLTVGVVDTELLLRESLAGKYVNLEREKFTTSYQNTFKDAEAKLRTEDQELQQQRGVLAPDVYNKRAQDFQQKIAAFQDTVRDKQERLEFSTNQAVQEIYNSMLVVAQEVAKERGLNAVMARQALFFFDPSMDITKPVLDKLNARLPTVAYQNPDTLTAPGVPATPAAGGAKPSAPAKK